MKTETTETYINRNLLAAADAVRDLDSKIALLQESDQVPAEDLRKLIDKISYYVVQAYNNLHNDILTPAGS